MAPRLVQTLAPPPPRGRQPTPVQRAKRWTAVRFHRDMPVRVRLLPDRNAAGCSNRRTRRHRLASHARMAWWPGLPVARSSACRQRSWEGGRGWWRGAASARRRPGTRMRSGDGEAWARGRDTCVAGVGAPRTTGTGRDAARAAQRVFLASYGRQGQGTRRQTLRAVVEHGGIEASRA